MKENPELGYVTLECEVFIGPRDLNDHNHQSTYVFWSIKNDPTDELSQIYHPNMKIPQEESLVKNITEE